MLRHPLRYGNLKLKHIISEEKAVAILTAAAQVCTHLGIVYDEAAVEKTNPVFLDIIKLDEALKEANVGLIDTERFFDGLPE